MVRAATLGGVAAVFGAVVILRWQEGFSNVDDYLYAAQTRAYFDALPDPGALVDAWRANGSNAPALPTLALPLAAAGSSPHWLVVVQLIPLLVLVASVRSLLGSLGVAPRAAWIGAGGIGLLAPVLGYAAMYHFGLAAAACTALAFAAYARSDRLARRRPALVRGPRARRAGAHAGDGARVRPGGGGADRGGRPRRSRPGTAGQRRARRARGRGRGRAVVGGVGWNRLGLPRVGRLWREHLHPRGVAVGDRARALRLDRGRERLAAHRAARAHCSGTRPGPSGGGSRAGGCSRACSEPASSAWPCWPRAATPGRPSRCPSWCSARARPWLWCATWRRCSSGRRWRDLRRSWWCRRWRSSGSCRTPRSRGSPCGARGYPRGSRVARPSRASAAGCPTATRSTTTSCA